MCVSVNRSYIYICIITVSVLLQLHDCLFVLESLLRLVLYTCTTLCIGCMCVVNLAVLTVIKEPPQNLTVFLGRYDVLDFTCVTDSTTSVIWVNGTSGEKLSLEHPEDVSMRSELRGDGLVAHTLTIAVREQNNGTVLECVAVDIEAQRIETKKASLLIQGTSKFALQYCLDLYGIICLP